MLILNSTKTIGRVLSKGEFVMQVTLNGGGATLEIQMEGSSGYVSAGALEEGVKRVVLPEGLIRIVSVTGSPEIVVD